MNLRLLLFLLCISFSAHIVAQDRVCGTMEKHMQLMQFDPLYKLRYEQQLQAIISARQQTIDTIITIPIIVHILYNTAEENISDTQIKSQIDVLNEDYSTTNSNIVDVPVAWQSLVKDAKIRFCLARTSPTGNATSGIQRIETSISQFAISDPRVYTTFDGGSDGWPSDQYLNIWVCKLANNALGYASFPGSIGGEDGVVISYKAFGRIGENTKTPYNRGRTTTHEIGHWLGLTHIWGDDNGACPVGPNQIGDDGFSDTPAQGNNNYRCPSFPEMDACSPVSPGIMYMNFMDYTDDQCMMFFTPQQINRMRNTINVSRPTILTSIGTIYHSFGVMEACIDSIITPVIATYKTCFQPSIRVRNNGTVPLTNLQFRYRLNEGLEKKYTYSDTISVGTSAIVSLPEISAPLEDRILEIRMLPNDSIANDNYVSISVRMSPSAIQNCNATPAFVYPNPVGISQLACLKTNYQDSRDMKIKVYDAAGRIVISRDLQMNAGDALPLDMRTLRAGMYIVELKSPVSVETIKFICQPDENSVGYGYVCN